MKAGLVDGKHYTDYVETVKELKRRDDLGKAETLLLRLIQAVEEEARTEGWIVAPWYYQQLAIIYRKQRATNKELEVLKRFASQWHAQQNPLVDRLQKLEALNEQKQNESQKKVVKE